MKHPLFPRTARPVQMQKRGVVLFLLTALLFGGTIVRFYQLSGGEELAAAARTQSAYTLAAGSARGTIYDCKNRPLTNAESKTVSVAAATPAVITAIRASFPADEAEALLARLTTGRPAVIAGLDATDRTGAVTFTLPVRYSADSCATQLIGYVNQDGDGVCGIEKSFDAMLDEYSGSVTVRYRADAWGRALTGEAFEVQDTTAQSIGGVVLTIDRDIQQMAEQVMTEHIPVGAAVILEAATGKIRAMVSTPGYDPNDVASAVNAENAPLLNRALCAYNVGSVFKLVTACCAAEQGETGLTMDCTGTMDYFGRAFRCIYGGAHGAVDLSRAVAISCNCYFIQLADCIGASTIRSMAKKLGFGQKCWLASDLASDAGKLPALQDLSAPAALANFSFGQGELLATPLQVAAMLQVIANDGQKIEPALVEYTVNPDKTPQGLQAVQCSRVLSAHSAQLVRGYMAEAVTAGTASKASPEQGGAGAKTATAETGWYVGGQEVIQAWCAGFYPLEQPKYVIVVFAENGRSGSGTCAPVFKLLADGLNELDLSAEIP